MHLITRPFLTCALALAGLAPAWSEDAIPVRNSISTKPIIEGVAKLFMAAHPGPDFASVAGLSADAIKAVAAGEAQMASVVRDLKPAEKEACPELKAQPFCIDVMVLVVHHDNAVAHLTAAQVKDLFCGGIASWKDVGGADAPPVLVARIDTFASLEFFESSFGVKRVVEGEGAAKTLRFKAGGPTAAMPSTNEKALAAVIANPAAITFASLGAVNDLKAKGAALKTVHIDGIEPNAANVVAGKYAAKRHYCLITKGEPQGRIKDFITFLSGPEGQKVIVDKGYLPLAK